jgi:hypothetical protein
MAHADPSTTPAHLTMKLIIAGGRNQHLSLVDRQHIRRFVAHRNVSEIVTGGANGVDYEAGQLAKELGIPVVVFQAEWSLGKFAGPKRNRDMAQYADAVMLFPGGSGTASMAVEAYEADIEVIDCR